MKRVYFIKPVGLPGPVKIGCSVAPEGRLRTMSAWSPVSLELTATVEGGHDLEVAIHHRFAHLAMQGEWFAIDAELDAFIQSVRNGILPRIDADFGGIANRRIANIKSAITRSVGMAERHAFGFRMSHGTGRPAHIRAIIDGFQGPDANPPSPAEQQALVEYVTDLRARPASRASWDERWKAWEQYRDGPLGLGSVAA